jgi:uncharacterized protein YjbI with pentapeptide repeats
MPECTHYDICGLPDDADPHAGLCILHSAKADKDPEAFAEALTAHRQTKGDRFAYMVFPDMNAFMSDTLPIAVDFSSATFSSIVFFNDVTFSEANFEGTTFSAGAAFNGAAFPGQANFGGATFSAGAFFDFATFSAEADFDQVTFSAKARFKGVKFSSGADFQRTQFTGRVSFWASHFMGRTIFAFVPPALGQGEEPQHEESSGPTFARAQEVDFSEVFIVPPDALIIQHTDLQRCRFLDTDLRKIEITGVIWPRRGYRLVVYDEIAPMQDPYPWDQLERLYRELKQNYDDRRKYLLAGEFHYSEKEMQRRNPGTPWSLKIFLWLYWLVSGYGSRFLPPLIWAIGLLVVGSWAYLWWGLLPKSPGVTIAPVATGLFVLRVTPDSPPPLAITKSSDWLSAMHYSLRVMTLLRPDDLVPVGVGKVVYTLQSLLGPLFLGLFALAVRQRLKH